MKLTCNYMSSTWVKLVHETDHEDRFLGLESQLALTSGLVKQSSCITNRWRCPYVGAIKVIIESTNSSHYPPPPLPRGLAVASTTRPKKRPGHHRNWGRDMQAIKRYRDRYTEA
jgi:hypothetical protein